jgi:hypothetical protein
MPECFFRSLPDAGPCDGRLVHCHLVKRQVLERELGRSDGRVAAQQEWSWVWGCGGPMGPGGHHGQFKPDGPKPIPLSLLPVDFTRRMSELGLWWYVERTFNRRSSFEDTFTSTEDGAAAAAVAAEAYIGRRPV